jgi:hypothetical protein
MEDSFPQKKLPRITWGDSVQLERIIPWIAADASKKWKKIQLREHSWIEKAKRWRRIFRTLNASYYTRWTWSSWGTGSGTTSSPWMRARHEWPHSGHSKTATEVVGMDPFHESVSWLGNRLPNQLQPKWGQCTR